jgi:AAA+ superfamily predicted ATPase
MGKKQNIWAKTQYGQYKAIIECEMVRELAPGVYAMSRDDQGNLYMNEQDIHLDELLEFPSSINSYVIRQVTEFWGKKAKFDEYGFAFKRGILLHGKAGSGKSSIINLCTRQLINEEKGIVIPLSGSNDFSMFINFMPTLRKIEKVRPIIVIIEDIENMLRNPELESALLNVLDGIDQTSHVVYMATTNYPELLKERITNRPSRFDRRIEVPLPSTEDRTYYFEHKLKDSDKTEGLVERWARDTEGMSISHLAEIIKSVCVLEMNYSDILSILKDMMDFSKLSSTSYGKDEGGLGFSKNGHSKKVGVHEELATKVLFPYIGTTNK